MGSLIKEPLRLVRSKMAQRNANTDQKTTGDQRDPFSANGMVVRIG